MRAFNTKRPAGPYPGLRPFQPYESSIFFGRAEQIDGMLAKLETRRFLAVVGASGSGKSSLVLAGLLPALADGFLMGASDEWDFVIARPGNAPYTNLAAAFCAEQVATGNDPTPFELSFAEARLHSGRKGIVDLLRKTAVPDERHVLVLIDQFEELFRFRDAVRRSGDQATADVQEQRNEAIGFVDLLLSTAAQAERPVYVMITMRSDYIRDCDAFFGLPEAISESQFLTPRLTRDQLAEAIAEPLVQFDGRVEPEVMNLISNEVGSDPDQLPLMQHALLRMWRLVNDGAVQNSAGAEQESGSEPLTLTVEHYKRVGGVERALDQHAEDIYAELKNKKSSLGDITERVFKTLTEEGSDNRGIRRPTRLDRLCQVCGAEECDVVDVIEAFRAPGGTFLMPSAGVKLQPDTVVDISHESLMRVWKQLHTWTEEEAESVRIYRRLVDTADEYTAGHENLLRDPALQVGLDWRDKQKPTAAWAALYQEGFETAMGFLQASKAQAEEEQVRRISIRRTVFVGMLLFISIVVLFFLIDARMERMEDKSRELLSAIYQAWPKRSESRETIEKDIKTLQALETAHSLVASELEEKFKTNKELGQEDLLLNKVYRSLEEKKRMEDKSRELLSAIYKAWPKRSELRETIEKDIKKLQALDPAHSPVASELEEKFKTNKELGQEDLLLNKVYRSLEEKLRDDAGQAIQELENNPHAALAQRALERVSDEVSAQGGELLSAIYKAWPKRSELRETIEQDIKTLQALETAHSLVASELEEKFKTNKELGQEDLLLNKVYRSLEENKRDDAGQAIQELDERFPDGIHAYLAQVASDKTASDKAASDKAASDKVSAQGGELLSAIYKAWPKRSELRETIEQDIKTLQALETAYSPVASELEEKFKNNKELGSRDLLLNKVYRSLEENDLDRARVELNKLDNHATLARMALEQSKSSGNRGFMAMTYDRTIYLQIVTIISLLLICSIWPAWQWNRRRSREEEVGQRLGKKAKIKTKPNPIWRALAGVVDFCVAVVLGILFGTFGQSIALTIESLVTIQRPVLESQASTIIDVIVFACTVIAYSLFRDAIKFRHHRSIGKIIFQLRPVMMTPEIKAAPMTVLIKRNWILVPFVIPITFLLIDYLVMDLEVLYPIWLELERELSKIIVILLVLFLLLEFTLATIKEGRTLQDRLAKTRVIHIRSEEAMAIDSGRRLSSTSQEYM